MPYFYRDGCGGIKTTTIRAKNAVCGGSRGGGIALF